MTTSIAFRLSGAIAGLLMLPAAASPQQPKAPAPRATTVSTNVILTIASPTTMYYGESVDGSAEVSSADGSPPSGTITFYDGPASICVLSISPGASCPVSAGEGFAAGTHAVTAVYSGDANHGVSTSNAVTITVLKDTTTALLSVSANPATAGQTITLTAAIQGAHATASGSVIFYDGTNSLAILPLDASGNATLVTTILAAGTHSISAVFVPTANFASSTSPSVSEQIQAAAATPAPSFSIATDSVSVEVGQSVAIPVALPASANSGGITLACSNLPDEATCSFLPGSKPSLVLKTAAPRDCGSTTPYGSTSLPLAAPVAAAAFLLFVPRRRSSLRSLLMALITVAALGTITGCGTGNCTDLGTRPGTYTITVTGTATGAATLTKQLKVTVTI